MREYRMIEALEPVYKRLEEIATWQENWNGYTAMKPDVQAIAKAKDWITMLYERVTQDTWIEPTFVTPDVSDGTIVFEWFHGQRKITIFFEDNDEVEALQVWDNSIECDITDHPATTVENCAELWQWLLDGDVPEDIYPDIVTLSVPQFADVLLAAR